MIQANKNVKPMFHNIGDRENKENYRSKKVGKK